MSAEITTVKRVFLKQKALQNSAYHRAYAPAPVQPDSRPGADQALIVLEFWAGVAYDVPQATYDQFAALGIATKEPPPSRWDQR